MFLYFSKECSFLKGVRSGIITTAITTATNNELGQPHQTTYYPLTHVALPQGKK